MPYGPMNAERDLPAVARLIAHAFGGTRDGSSTWITSAGAEHVRTLRDVDAETPAACFLRIPMGQYFGGRSVPMLGIAGVAVAPESRGRGHALKMMREAILEAKRDGFPLSCLYASTQSLYRQVGYEQAGHRCEIRIPLSQIDVRERAAPIAPISESDRPHIRACYTAMAPRFNGMLDRTDYCWNRVENFREEQYTGFAVPSTSPSDAAVDAYAYMSQRRKPDTGRHDVALTDLAYTTPAAGRRLLGFFADFATVGDDLVFHGGPHHPILALLSQQRFTVRLKDYWMLRLVDAKAALEARGYSPGLSAEVHLDLRDDLIPDNNRRMVLHVEDGHATVRDGGRADLVLDIKALAAVYSGLVPARALPLMGHAAGDDRSLATLGAALNDGTPWMTDYF